MLTSSSRHLRAAIKLSTAHAFSGHLGRKIFLATYKTSTSASRKHRLLLGFIKGMEPKWPNGTDSTTGVGAAEYLWGYASEES
jgi:hypothetical protein